MFLNWNYGRCKFVVAAMLAATPAFAEMEFTPDETAHLCAALAAMNASVADLGFAKDLGEPRSALRWIRDALHEPLALNRAAQRLWESALSDSSSAWWAVALELMEMKEPAVAPETAPPVEEAWDGIDPTLGAALTDFMRAARIANALLDRAFAQLSRDELGWLAAHTLSGAMNFEDREEDRQIARDAGISEDAIAAMIEAGRQLDATPTAERFLALAERVELDALFTAGRVFQSAVEALAERAMQSERWPDAPLRFATELGLILITAGRDAEISEPALLIVSPPACTTYRGAAGVANGLRGQLLAAIVDLGGDDSYVGDGLLGPGTALFGVSVVIDVSGNDVWRHECVGPAAGLWGVGWVEDRSGDDLYAGRALGQGAAVAGVGVLSDRAGNDSYRIGWQGQGFAGWRGFGLLVDRAGHDRYDAGGLEADHERNPDRFLSLAQGFAIGQRPFAGGGVGALVDLSGNDRYQADVYGQGVSYYYSAGFLLDGGGHDRYDVHHYGQGCGIHLSLGFLADLAGDDMYNGGTLVQGAAHDFAVGGLLDRGGSDTYIAVRNAQGHGMNNSVGWLLNAAGEDVYSGRDLATTQGVGNSGGTRESGSIGLLLDLGGSDGYSSGGEDGRITLRPWYGAVYDVEVPVEAETRP
ncbi:MAG TPA: hypothetical protein PKE12_09280 [Kiritimatiellia bacterium]|nr:hypothetical protein [Kiritimatiellia bacterium]